MNIKNHLFIWTSQLSWSEKKIVPLSPVNITVSCKLYKLDCSVIWHLFTACPTQTWVYLKSMILFQYFNSCSHYWWFVFIPILYSLCQSALITYETNQPLNKARNYWNLSYDIKKYSGIIPCQSASNPVSHLPTLFALAWLHH